MTEKRYRTFKRSCRDWDSFSKARKITDRTNLTLAEARHRCETFNANLTPAQKRRGTRYEFESM